MPAQEKLEWPEGKLRQPSWRVWCSVSVQTDMETRPVLGVLGAALHLSSRSGLGLPIAFLARVVSSSDRTSVNPSPRRETCALCSGARKRSMTRITEPRGT